ncbi:hypothetical protein Amal_03475 [Acetobacter malorum]|uniref:Uncharacterized protein n=1 Tax=Acetobacter malorum TaxID=178901 RepID=A0A177G682_9PROT|nr:hypothetical protein Amal_03475 [Acetobacter malorum]
MCHCLFCLQCWIGSCSKALCNISKVPLYEALIQKPKMYRILTDDDLDGIRETLLKESRLSPAEI